MSNPNRSRWRTLTDELVELERTNPAVKAAAVKVEIAVARALGCKHLLACKPGSGCTIREGAACNEVPGSRLSGRSDA